jgi:two-component system sensor histidine kinase VicK
MSPFLKLVAGLGNIYTKLKYPKIWLILLLPLFLFSCEKKNTLSAGYSDAFKVTFDTVTHYFDRKQPDSAIRSLDQSYHKIHNPTVNDRFRFYGFHYIYWQKAKLDYKKALVYADSMLMMAHNSVTREQYAANFAEGNYAKGDSYFDLKQYNDAYQCYFQGYEVAKNYLQQASLADYTYRMGMIMFDQEHYKLAAEYFKESYRQSHSLQEDFVQFYRRQELLDNIAISYRHNGDLDSAVKYFDRALVYIDTNKKKFGSRPYLLEIAKGVIEGNKAEVLILRGQNAQARELLKRSIDVNLHKGGDNRDAEYTEIKLADLYLISNKKDSLINLLQNLRHQLDTVHNEEVEADWNRLMGTYYYGKKDLEKAIVYTRNYNVLKDSVIKRLSALKETDVNQQLANLEKQDEIASLSNNNKLQRLYLNVALVCGILLVIIMFLVWRTWRRSKFDMAVVIMLNKQVNEQKTNLEKALDELKYSSQEKDRILRAVAHDLRNPLGGIASLSGVMVDESEHDKDMQMQLALIKDTATDSLELINEILEATKNTSEDLKKQRVDVNAMLNNSVELLRFKAAEKHQQILLEGLDKSFDITINREKIWRVLSNLISNAIKFSPVDSAIRVKALQKKDHIVVSVIDQGIGIPDNMKEKVFNMFTDAKRPGTIGEKSFGLGLSISKQIIEKHGGKIWFDSEVNKGTTFYISLPTTGKKDTSKAGDQSEAGLHMVV